MRKEILLVLILSACWLALVAGCNVINPSLQTPHSITINPKSGTMLAYTTQRFTAKGYDRNGNEIYFTPMSWPSYPTGFGTVTSRGRDSSNRPYVTFKPTSFATGELFVFYNDVQTHATITSVATVASISISPESISIQGNHTFAPFIATAYDPDGNVINLITPTWEAVGSIGTITTVEGNQATFRATNEASAFGTIEAYLGGVVGSAEITVTTEGTY